MRTALIFAYFLSPSPAIGAVRLDALRKRLPALGWDTVFVTPRLPGRGPSDGIREVDVVDARTRLSSMAGLDGARTIHEQLPVDLVSGRLRHIAAPVARAAKSVVFFPDQYRNWCGPAERAGLEILSSRRVDVILTSSYPVSSHLVGHRLARRTGVPWVADLRDLWTQDHHYPYSGLRRRFERRYERRCLSRAAALTTVSGPYAETLGTLHAVPVECIPNGFDDDLLTIEAVPRREFRLLYAGSLLSGSRDPRIFLAGLSRFVDRLGARRSEVRVDLYTRDEPWLRATIEETRLDEIVHVRAMIGRREIQAEQRAAQILLLLLGAAPADAGVYTGKVFEYLAARRPILAVNGPPGVVDDMLKSTGAGAFENTPDGVAARLAAWWSEYETAGLVACRSSARELERFSQSRMAKQFADLFDRLAASRSRPAEHREDPAASRA